MAEVATRPPASARAAERAAVRRSRPGYAALRVAGAALASLLLLGSAASAVPTMMTQRVTNQLDLPAGMTSLTIEASHGDVDVTEGRAPRALVYSAWTLHQPQPQLVDDGGGRWRLTSRCEGSNLGVCSSDVEVVLPPGVDVVVTSTYGDLDVSASGSVHAESVTGDIDVQVGGSGTYAVDAQTEHGDRNVTVASDPAATRTVTLRTTFGDVDVTPSD